MRKINIYAFGKIKESYLREGIAEYLKRLTRYAKVNIIELSDCAIENEAVTREGEALLKYDFHTLITLDIEGKPITSVELSEMIDKFYLTTDTIDFVIGGSYGLDERIKAKSHRISLGAVTYPHQLVRLMLLEQIYRSFSIIGGTPYHK